MPGQNPQEAFRAFLAPLSASLACLGPAKFKLSKGGQAQPNVDHSWNLNDKDGMKLRSGIRLEASMWYRIEKREPSSQYKVTTLSYQYDIYKDDVGVVSIHWHPRGLSYYIEPHLHLWPHGFDGSAFKAHLSTPRLTFEDAIEWCIELGAQPRGEWRSILARNREAHRLHRSWDHMVGGSL